MFFLLTEMPCSYLHFANMISNVGSCGDGLRKKTQIQTRQGLLLKVIKVKGLASSI